MPKSIFEGEGWDKREVTVSGTHEVTTWADGEQQFMLIEPVERTVVEQLKNPTPGGFDERYFTPTLYENPETEFPLVKGEIGRIEGVRFIEGN